MSAAPRVGLLKRFWNEYPDIFGSSIMAGIGITIALFGLYNHYQKDGENRKYRLNYTVIRHDDPKAAKVRKD